MKHPDSTDHEWFQVNIIFGHFDNHKDAESFIKWIKERTTPEFISAEIKGSWH